MGGCLEINAACPAYGCTPQLSLVQREARSHTTITGPAKAHGHSATNKAKESWTDLFFLNLFYLFLSVPLFYKRVRRRRLTT